MLCARCGKLKASAVAATVGAAVLTGVPQCVITDLAAHPQCECDRLHAHEGAAPSTVTPAGTGMYTSIFTTSGSTASSMMLMALTSSQTPTA